MACIFCKIAREEIPAQIVYHDELATAFRDINPKAPVHILVIPNQHLTSLHDAVGEDHQTLVGHLLQVCAQIAEQEKIAQDGYRVVTNIGRNAGQSVDHLHFHVLGGRPMHWPPG
ncbi:MAG: histidine triad nucleotide-binding protein [Chloroflexi bacterium]|nr:histidine triad nucleotide-binding protein [Chloroflexota bacterium]